MNKIKVLFLCSRNSARSQMAEAFLRKYGGDEFEPYSAGLEASEIHPLTIKVMEEKGISMDGLCSKSLDIYLNDRFGFLITVCSKAEKECPFFPGVSIRLHWPFDDPAAAQGSEEERLESFRKVRDQIEKKVIDFVENTDKYSNIKDNFRM
ncbi:MULTISPECIES: arsenate reductase ArsC [Petrotoga]|uniref:Arsenate reductase n=2 Tax=Petrotoga sibirica TaxID=156202 RepID=A0A4R8EHL1_9BACT|nr:MULTISPECIES: arsenate reductase ArsC [Petrotoga]POZ87811.1 protein tyrosine phosphatase [Petrotoga sibirica DSM 13575]POZ89851.1 protein tyrosine phosphatase [Petrotoga sp. SL27]TDX11129.1 arsenate reductase [Petrotoga sibirica]